MTITSSLPNDDEFDLIKLNKEISSSQEKMKTYRDNLEHALNEGENFNSDKNILDQIISNRDNLVNESSKNRYNLKKK